MSAIRSVGTAITALALGLSVPVTSAAAAVRPGSAVPSAAASSAISSSAQNVGGNVARPWPAYALIALTIAVGAWLAFDDGGNGYVGISRA